MSEVKLIRSHYSINARIKEVTPMSRADEVLIKIADSLDHLGQRLDRVERRERARNDALEAERRYRRQMSNQAANADLQGRADDALEPWGIRAPAPSAEDTRRSYRLRLGRLCQAQLPPGDELRRLDLSAAPSDVLDIFEPRIFQACKDAVHRVDTLAPGQEREIRVEKDGRRFSSFVAEKSFVIDMQPEARRVTQFAKRDGTFREE
jgi:hypothetical protein